MTVAPARKTAWGTLTYLFQELLGSPRLLSQQRLQVVQLLRHDIHSSIRLLQFLNAAQQPRPCALQLCLLAAKQAVIQADEVQEHLWRHVVAPPQLLVEAPCCCLHRCVGVHTQLRHFCHQLRVTQIHCLQVVGPNTKQGLSRPGMVPVNCGTPSQGRELPTPTEEEATRGERQGVLVCSTAWSRHVIDVAAGFTGRHSRPNRNSSRRTMQTRQCCQCICALLSPAPHGRSPLCTLLAGASPTLS